ncbi:MAG: hypothetical protein NTZ90_11920 [Proteobacteria bacterium]|nr:hypothetical protein [Pseudomonadota bacterium]
MWTLTRCLVALACYTGYGYIAVAAPASGSCVHIPEVPDPSPGKVSACETATTYTFDVAGQHYEFAKEIFRDQLRTVLGNWAQQSQIVLPQDAWIDYWLAVPEGSPQGTMARAVVSWKTGALVAYLDLAPERWDLRSQNVGVLTAEASYPASFGYQAETLLVKHGDQADLDAVHRFMLGYGATVPSPLNRGWEVYHVAAMEEASTAKAIRSAPDFSRNAMQVEFNAMVEWIATRQRVFAFSLARP